MVRPNKSWLTISGIDYIDRNNDGKVDLELRERGAEHDGIDLYFIDDDFDGFYDRKVQGGGYSGKFQTKKIHQKVAPIKKLNCRKVKQSWLNYYKIKNRLNH